jgi:hypothetical protein
VNSFMDPARNKKGTVWIALLGVAVALIICYVVAGTAGAMILFPPARTLVYGVFATEQPTPLPGTRPTRVRPTLAQPAPAVQAPPEVVVQAGIIAGAYTLYDFAPDWEELTSPGINNWDISFAYDQPVSLDTGWCATTGGVLDENFRHITFLLEIDSQDIPVQDLLWADGPGNDGTCRSYSGFVQAWPIGSHTVVMTMRLDRMIDDGWNNYPAGDYVDRFNITVTP